MDILLEMYPRIIDLLTLTNATSECIKDEITIFPRKQTNATSECINAIVRV